MQSRESEDSEHESPRHGTGGKAHGTGGNTHGSGDAESRDGKPSGSASRRHRTHHHAPKGSHGSVMHAAGSRAGTPSAAKQASQSHPADDPADARRTIRSFFNLRDGRASFSTIHKRIVDGARINGIHLCILIVAMLIASIGLNVNSTEAIVGAMLICPLMGSVLAIAYSIATADAHFLKDSLLGLLMQIAICLATSTLYFLISPLSNETSELLTNSSPTIWDVLIALAGGFAGGIGNSRKEEPSTLIAGVAVATALMPPLCASGYGIAMRNLGTFLNAFYEFLLNVVFIALSAEVVFMLLRVPLHVTDAAGDQLSDQQRLALQLHAQKVRRRLVVGTLIFLIPCGLTTAEVVAQTMSQNGGAVFDQEDQYATKLTTQELEAICPEVTDYRIGEQDSYDAKQDSLDTQVVAHVTTSQDLTQSQRRQVEDLIRVHVPQLDFVHFETSPAAQPDAQAS